MQRVVSGTLVAAMAALTGCQGGMFPFLANLSLDPPIERAWLRTEGRASVYFEEGVDDGEWLEVTRANGDGVIGGYLSTDPHNGVMILMLDGANTLVPDGEVGGARQWHGADAQLYQENGYLTYSLGTQECGVPYGQGDVDEAVEILDWLDEEGKALFGVHDVFVYGYSAGAIAAVAANTRREATGYICFGGLYEPDQLIEDMWLYQLVVQISPNNEGLCQLKTTLQFYGPPDSPAWGQLDIVSRIEELHSPMLIGHGLSDTVWCVGSAQHLQQRYDELAGSGVELPEIEFMFVPGWHFAPKREPEAQQQTLEFLDRHATH